MIEIYTDGATDGQGWSGVGIVIKHENEVDAYSIPIGRKHSNHEAEFEAIVRALTLCKQMHPKEILSFRTDAKVVVDIVEKEFTKNSLFQPYLRDVLELSAGFPLFFIKWIPQQTNTHADRLARQAIFANEKG